MDIKAWSTEVVVEEVADQSAEVVSSGSWWRTAARWSLYAAAILLPLLFSSLTIPPTFIRQTVLSILTFVAFIAFLGESLMSGRLTYKRTLINAALLLVLAVLFISTFLSPQALNGILGNDDTGERFVSFLILAVIYFVMTGVLFAKEESSRFFGALMAGGFLLSLLSLFQFFAPSVIPFSSLARADVNTIGTTNALGVILGTFFILALGLVVGTSKAHLSRYSRVLLYLFLTSLFVNLLVINFRSIWIGVVVAGAVLLGFKLLSQRETMREHFMHDRAGLVPLFVALAVSIFFILSQTAVIRIAAIPAEVSPSYNATLSITREALKENPVFGSGPGTFGMDYSLYRDPSINQTNFWGVRFNTGSAFVPTMVATTGILGGLALIVFMLVTGFTLFRQVARRVAPDPVVMAGTAGVIFILLMWWLYTATLPLQALLFMLLGLLVARMGEPSSSEGEDSSIWRVSERSFAFVTPWTTFVMSLLIIFLMVGGVAFLYYNIQHFTGAVAFAKGVNASNDPAKVDEAIDQVAKAVSLNPDNDQYYRALSQVLLRKVQAIVQSANSGSNSNLQNEFQVAVSNAIGAGQRATAINPSDALNWSTLAFVYQSIVPFIQGSEQFAVEAYDKAIAGDPNNPSYEFNKASTYLSLADRVQLLLSQPGANQEALAPQLSDALMKAREALEKSVQLKPDYAQANYLLAQVLIREGNVARAISQVEAVRQLAPFDIGVAFQLGVLYYQSNRLADAEAEFLRSLSLNDQYSNARYFLGLIYDRKGDTSRALLEFERIEALNPDNQEVKIIISNLKAGKPALTTISPPAPAPAARKEPPVKDSGNPKPTLP